MKTEIKELLDEMIQYDENRKPIRYLKRMFEEEGDSEIYFINGYLLQWHKEVFLDLKRADKYEISDISYKYYLTYFEKCPELKKVFSVYKDHIGWASTVTKEEQDEIRNYIHENYKVQIRIRRDERLKK